MQQKVLNPYQLILKDAQLPSSVKTVQCEKCKAMVNAQSMTLHQIKCNLNQLKNKGQNQQGSILRIKKTSSTLKDKQQSQIKQKSKIKPFNKSYQSGRKQQDKNNNISKRSSQRLKIFPEQRQSSKLMQKKQSKLKQQKSQLKQLKSQLKQLKSQLKQQKIACINCGYMQTLSELDTHPNQCLGSYVLCKKCQSRYPALIIDDHYYLCKEQAISDIEIQEQIYKQKQEEQYFDVDLNNRHQQLQEEKFYDFPQQENSYEDYEDWSEQQYQEEFRRHIRELAQSSLHQRKRGVPKDKLNQIKQHIYNNENLGQAQQCPICYLKFEEKQMLIWLRCTHCFHSQCVKEWLIINPCCPCCKTDFQQKQRE